jgi:hypothetical protein
VQGLRDWLFESWADDSGFAAPVTRGRRKMSEKTERLDGVPALRARRRATPGASSAALRIQEPGWHAPGTQPLCSCSNPRRVSLTFRGKTTASASPFQPAAEVASAIAAAHESVTPQRRSRVCIRGRIHRERTQFRRYQRWKNARLGSHEGVLVHLALRAVLPNLVAAALASASRAFQSSGGRPRFSMRLKT